mmetsp:Transcript_22746/g.73347  ORF Transcript_22746/g.73347 Transcript_22746/m.73347 type:complete len:204 (+) Transcript_22746:1390-2001(+)
MPSDWCTARLSSSTASSSRFRCSISAAGAPCSTSASASALTSSGSAPSASAISCSRSTTSIEMSEFSCISKPSSEETHLVRTNVGKSSGAVASTCSRLRCENSSSSESMNFSGRSGYFMRSAILSLIRRSTASTIAFIPFSSTAATSTCDSSNSRSARARSSAASSAAFPLPGRARLAGGCSSALLTGRCWSDSSSRRPCMAQ